MLGIDQRRHQKVKKVKPLKIIGKDFRNRPPTSEDSEPIAVSSNLCTVVGYINRNKNLPKADATDDLPDYCAPHKEKMPEEGEEPEWKPSELLEFQTHVRDYDVYGDYTKNRGNDAFKKSKLSKMQEQS
jgi:hypothetical protein